MQHIASTSWTRWTVDEEVDVSDRRGGDGDSALVTMRKTHGAGYNEVEALGCGGEGERARLGTWR